MKKFFVWLGVILFFLFIVIWIGGKWILSFSAADYDGEFKSSKILNPVEITYDKMGIPQIWAETNSDLYYSLGWAHASERLFQMELVRRYSKGELSELFGKRAFELDKFQRTIGFKRKAAEDAHSLAPKYKALLESYCAGINDFIDYKTILPPEFLALGLTPEKWTPEDCLAILYYQTWFSHALMDRDKVYRKLVSALGGGVKNLITDYLEWSPSTIDKNNAEENFTLNFNPKMSLSSNSWVASPDKSVSGKALHASDPHLAINSAPGFWYIAGLHSQEGINAVGITAPGIPMITMGHNDSIAFAFTVASVDIIDYYGFEKNPSDSLSIKTFDGYKKLKIINDKINIKDENPKIITILQSEIGPVVESDSDSVEVLHWAGFDFNAADMMENGMKLISAHNFFDFRKAVTGLGALDVNWTYSDINGNIGYQLGAPIPIRSVKNTFVELDGADKANYWRGYRSLGETPFAFNPDKGWLATCNNQIVPENFDYNLPGFYDPYRIIRANELLSGKEKFSADDFKKYQMDRKSGTSIIWRDLFLAGAVKLNNHKIIKEISDWDLRLNKESKIAAVFRLWYNYLPKYLFEDELGDNWRNGRYILKFFIDHPVAEVIDNKNTPAVETFDDISASALAEAAKAADGKTLGQISKLVVRHPLSEVGILDKFFNLSRGPFPQGGDAGTLSSNFSKFDESSNTFSCQVGPSMRFVLDWADVDGFTMNINLGQSGNPFSEHYDDFLLFNRSGKRWNVPFSKKLVFQRRKSIFKLLPKN